MPRRATGGIKERSGPAGTVYSARFTAYGRRRHVTFGAAADGWTRERAEAELANILADVRRQRWSEADPDPSPIPHDPDPSFHVFASDWYNANEGAWRAKTRRDYGYVLSNHLLPFFKRHRLSQITIAEVDRYRAAKVKQGKLSAVSINKTLTLLAQILEVAVEYG